VEIRVRQLRYRRLFAEVWASLPAADRAEIEPQIALVSDRLGDYTRRQQRRLIYAMVVEGKKGCKVLLRPRYLRELEDASVRGVIAHELAHVLCRHVTAGVLWAEGRKQAQLWGEAEANALAAAWGFRPPSPLAGLVAPAHMWMVAAPELQGAESR
jgi:Zn-dependent protease with chaperone function